MIIVNFYVCIFAIHNINSLLHIVMHCSFNRLLSVDAVDQEKCIINNFSWGCL